MSNADIFPVPGSETESEETTVFAPRFDAHGLIPVVATSAKTGEVLWQFQTGSGIIGQPTTYRGPDGRQYVAILSGVGGWAGAIVSGDLDPNDSTAAKGFVNAVRDLKNVTSKGGTLFVFSLP